MIGHRVESLVVFVWIHFSALRYEPSMNFARFDMSHSARHNTGLHPPILCAPLLHTLGWKMRDEHILFRGTTSWISSDIEENICEIMFCWHCLHTAVMTRPVCSLCFISKRASREPTARTNSLPLSKTHIHTSAATVALSTIRSTYLCMCVLGSSARYHWRDKHAIHNVPEKIQEYLQKNVTQLLYTSVSDSWCSSSTHTNKQLGSPRWYTVV